MTVMSGQRRRVGLGIVVVLATAGGCSAKNGDYCDQDTPCTGAELSYCDLTGALGSKNGCVRPPADGGTGRPDAATSGPCAGVDCSALDDGCNLGTCDPATGECAPMPREDGTECGEPSCEDWGACDGFRDDECAEEGVQYRTCSPSVCQAGACEPGDGYDEDRPCMRETDGDTCGDDTTTSGCGSCSFSSTCDESGTRTCTCVDHECGGGSCEAQAPRSCLLACSRTTDGDACGATTQGCPGGQTQPVCCNTSGSCNVDCGGCS